VIVVSDTSPLNYLVLLGQVDVLRPLYGRVVIPDVVLNELSHVRTPAPVLEWTRRLPTWVEVRSVTAVAGADPRLDAGELAAIQLALDLRADLVLIDDQPARVEAERLGLFVSGTLGVLVAAATHGLLEIEAVISQLQETNFRLSQSLAERAIAHVKASRGKP